MLGRDKQQTTKIKQRKTSNENRKSNNEHKMNKNQKILRIIFIVFTAVIALLAIDMARHTTAPWNKKKQAVRAWGGDTTPKDTLKTQK
jgi:anaerobic C4-dicarboxylate transporter